MIRDFLELMQPSNDAEFARLELWSSGQAFTAPPPERPECEALRNLARTAHAALVHDLITRIHMQPPEFFERLVIDVLLSMGYGAERSAGAQRLGRSGDGGVDGVILLDELGLDLVYIQAKRLKPGTAVPIADIRDFAGSLEARQAAKGVFVTTSHFSPGAAEFCSRLSRRVVLIDGARLADIMMRYNIGVVVEDCIVIKGLDRAYFGAGAAGEMRELNR